MIRTFIFIALILGALMLNWQTGMAGGPCRDVLFDTFCQGLPYNEKVGCSGYLQYRIQRGRNRDRALESCTWGCAEVLDDPAKIKDCQKGCRDMNAQDH